MHRAVRGANVTTRDHPRAIVSGYGTAVPLQHTERAWR